MKKRNRDIEASYPKRQFIQKLRRFADALEQGKSFRLTIRGQRLVVPKNAYMTIEHEREAGQEEVEFQVRWRQ